MARASAAALRSPGARAAAARPRCRWDFPTAGRRPPAPRVDDLAQYREKIVEARGKIIVEQMQVPYVGSSALFEDPDGRVQGIWTQLSAS